MTLSDADLLQTHEVIVRVFDVLRFLCGEAVLQVNVFGSIREAGACGYVDILASAVHMRWLRDCGDPSPSDKRNWSGQLADFATSYPRQPNASILGRHREEVGKAPLLSRRPCRRVEKRHFPQLVSINHTGWPEFG